MRGPDHSLSLEKRRAGTAYSQGWVDAAELSEQADLSGYSLYFQDKQYFLGLSYALALAFTVFALSLVKTEKNKGILGLFAGVSLSAGLYAFGCCGSPMMLVYAGLFGSAFLGFTKPLTHLCSRFPLFCKTSLTGAKRWHPRVMLKASTLESTPW